MALNIFIICLVTGMILIGAEIFVPGGILGMLGAVLLLVAIVVAFPAFPVAGPYVAVSIVFGAALALVVWIKVFPQTRMGRAMTVQNDLAAFKGTEDGLPELIGKTGVTVSPLRPAGFVMIDGKRIDVVTRGEMIGADRAVTVVHVEGNSVVVAETSNQA